jgi:hypothetical protein
MHFLLIALASIGIVALIVAAAYWIPVWRKPEAPDLSQPLERIELDYKNARVIFAPGRGRYPGLSGNSHQRRLTRRRNFFDGC